MIWFPEENGEFVLRGVQVVWFAYANQLFALLVVLLVMWFSGRHPKAHPKSLNSEARRKPQCPRGHLFPLRGESG